MLRLTLLTLLGALAAPFAHALLEVPKVFSDHMVLQRELPAPVWGKADPGATITVTFAGQTRTTTASPDGSWKVALEPLSASFDPRTLTVTNGAETLAFNDVLVGEVWLCSGQSNMEWNVRAGLDPDIEALAGRHPAIRLYKVERVAQQEPRFTAKAVWTACAPETVASFSAVGYFFGRDLRQVLDVPVGLIDASWGGTPAIAWTRASAFDRLPLLRDGAANTEAKIARYPELLAEWEKKFAAWKAANPGLPDNHNTAPRKPMGPDSPHRPSNLAHGMLATVAPYALRGALWYQGESDAGWEPDRYDERLRVTFEDWRQWWNLPDMAFGVVQLAGFMAPADAPTDTNWARLRESQRQLSRDLSRTGLAVAIDIGETNDIHPRDKQTVARRLSRWALTDIYQKISLRGGPELGSATVDGSSMRLVFTQTGKGLWAFNGEPLRGFTIAGEDRVFHPAEARIEGKDTVIVSSPAVPAPVAVRYAWANHPVGANLRNVERLPASPFRTDDWPLPPPAPATK